MKLWIDDERVTPAGYTHNALSSAQAIDLISRNRDNFELVSFDHDLGMVAGNEDTSRRVLLWMAEHEAWPDEIRFHTANPVGREWLVGTAQNFAPDSTRLDLTDPWRDPDGIRLG